MGKSSLFGHGYVKVAEEKKRQEVERSKRGSLFRLFVKKDEEVLVHFLTTEPVTFYEHQIPRARNGKEYYENITCCSEEKGCIPCVDGDRPQFKGAYLIWDYSEYTNKDGKKVKGTLRLYVTGAKNLSMIERIHSKKGLGNYDINIVRSGTGTATSYIYEVEDKVTLDEDEILDFLPEAMQEKYDGSEESLMAIIEEELAKSIKSDEYEEEVVEEKSSSKKGGISSRKKRAPVEDDEDDDDDEDYSKNLIGDDDEEEEEKPRSRKSLKTSTLKKGKKNLSSPLKKRNLVDDDDTPY